MKVTRRRDATEFRFTHPGRHFLTSTPLPQASARLRLPHSHIHYFRIF